MKVVKDFPPNFSEIKSVLNPDSTMVYTYGNIVYNPSGGEIPADIEYHETIHQKQQSFYTDPSFWWALYLNDKRFRLEQELEAFYGQWQFVKRSLPSKIAEECLDELAFNLSKLYNLAINRHQAKTLLRKFKTVA